MKIATAIVSFVLGLSLIVLVSSERPLDFVKKSVRGEELQDKDFGGATSSPREEFPYANRIEPEEYRRIYTAIREMPSENQIEGRQGKGLHAVDVNTSQWESFGPLGVPGKNDPTGDELFGRIRTMKWYYNTGGGTWERYLGAGSGGLWYGQPAFTMVIWQSLGDKLPNPSVGAIAIDPTDRNVIWVGTGDWGRDLGAGVYKSTDRGQSWTYNTYVGYYTTQIMYLVGNSVMIAAGDYGVYRSTDGGSNWALKTVEPASTHAKCFNLIAASPSRLYAALPKFGVYASNDGGSTWSKASTGLPTLCGSTLAIDFCKSNSEVLYAAYTDTNDNQGGIYKSTNSGVSWAPTSAAPTYVYSGQGFHTNVIRVHPTDPNTVYAASVGFVKSTDGGISWTSPEGGHPDHTAIEFDPGNSNLMYLCSDGGIVLRDDAANTISSKNYRFDPGAPLQVYEMDNAYSQSEVMLAGTQDNGNIVTVSGSQPGSLWTQISGCDGGNHLNIDPYNSYTFYGNQWCGDNSPRWRSTDQGWNFDNIDNGLANGPYSPVRYAKGGAKVLWTLSLSGLYNSYNTGDTWLASTTNAGNDFPGPYPWPALTVNNWATISNKVCYVVWTYINGPSKMLHNYVLEGTPGAMAKTDLPMVFDRLIPDRGNPDVVFGLRPGSIFRSSDHGHTWTNISGSWKNGIPSSLPVNDVVEISAGGAMYAGTSMGMFKSLDGGQNWFTFQNGLPVVSVQKILHVSGLKYDTLRIATYGRGFWQRLVDDVNPNLLANAPTNGIVLDLGGKNESVYGGLSHGKGIKSTDYGNSWNQFDIGTDNNFNAIGTTDNQTVIAAGDMGTVFRSTDAGTTWNPTAVPTAGNITGLSITTGGTSWMCTDDGMILSSTNGGMDWLPQTVMPGIVFRSCQFINGMIGMALGKTTVGGALPLVYVTTNGGEIWTPTYPPTTNELHKLFFTSDSDGFAVGDSGTIVRTTDAGTSWASLSSGTSVNLFSCFFSDQMTGWAVGDSGTILKTNDGGESWQSVPGGTFRNLRSVTMSNTKMLFGGDSAVYNFVQLHQNTVHYDLRNNWNLVSLPVDVADSSVGALFPSRSSNAFYYNGSAYATSSSLSGGTGYWVKFNGDQVLQTTGSPKSSLTVPVTTGWNLIGSTASFIQTSSIMSSPAGMITSPFFAYEGSYRSATTLQPGRAYWVKVSQAGTLTLGSSPVAHPGTGRISIVDRGEMPPSPPDRDNTASSHEPYLFALQQNYPNPFNPMTTIRFTLPEAGRITLKIYDVLGKEVKTLVEGMMEEGEKSVSWNSMNDAGSPVASGMYFYKLELDAPGRSEKYVSVHKMVIVK